MFWRRNAQRLIVEKAIADQATLDGLVALAKDQNVDAIGLNPAAMHALWTLSGLAEKVQSESVKTALQSACEAGFKHPSSPVRHAAVMSCAAEQIKSAVDANLQNDNDAKVRLAVLLRVADGGSANAIAADTLAVMTSGESSVAEDDILLDAWTSAAATQPVETLIALDKQGEKVSQLLLNRVGVLAEHIARSNPTAEQIESLLALSPNSKITLGVLQGLGKGWSRDHTVELSQEAQKTLASKFCRKT